MVGAKRCVFFVVLCQISRESPKLSELDVSSGERADFRFQLGNFKKVFQTHADSQIVLTWQVRHLLEGCLFQTSSFNGAIVQTMT